MGVKVVEEDMVRFIQQLEGRVAAEVHTKHTQSTSTKQHLDQARAQVQVIPEVTMFF